MKTIQKPVTSPNKKWRVRVFAVSYFTALMTLVSPLVPTAAPVLEVPAKADPIDFKQYAKQLMGAYNWGDKQFVCLDNIWTNESHWNPLANNPHSTAFGIAQILGEDSRDGMKQIVTGLRYIEHRYDTPCNAWSFWQRNHWY